MLQAVILAACTISSLRADTPLLVKSVTLNIMHPHDAVGLRCEVYADALVLTHFSDSGSTSSTRPLTIEGDVAALIEAAARDATEGETGPVDGTMCNHEAYQTHRDGTVQEIYLNSEADGKRSRNSSAAAAHLRAILDDLCP